MEYYARSLDDGLHHQTSKDPECISSSVDDYTITVEELPGLGSEVIDGL